VRAANNAAEADFDPRADFNISLVSKLVAVMTFPAFDEGGSKLLSYGVSELSSRFLKKLINFSEVGNITTSYPVL